MDGRYLLDENENHFSAQDHLKAHCALIIDYLAAQIEPKNSVNEIFMSVDDRLFFNESVNFIFTDPDFLRIFSSIYYNLIQSVVDITDEEKVKKFVEFFFEPIEKSDEWKLFWIKQKLLLQQHYPDEYISLAEKNRNLIAKAITSRIIDAWHNASENNPLINNSKFPIFNNLFRNCYSDIKASPHLVKTKSRLNLSKLFSKLTLPERSYKPLGKEFK